MDLTSRLFVSKVDFYYHMYGKYMGTLRLQTSSDGSTFRNVWIKSKNQGNKWRLASFDINSDVKAFRFAAVTGSGFRSDIAIDDFTYTCDFGSPTLQPSYTPPSQSPVVFTPTMSPKPSLQSSDFPTLPIQLQGGLCPLPLYSPLGFPLT
jgi:hypothetical protein